EAVDPARADGRVVDPPREQAELAERAREIVVMHGKDAARAGAADRFRPVTGGVVGAGAGEARDGKEGGVRGHARELALEEAGAAVDQRRAARMRDQDGPAGAGLPVRDARRLLERFLDVAREPVPVARADGRVRRFDQRERELPEAAGFAVGQDLVLRRRYVRAAG